MLSRTPPARRGRRWSAVGSARLDLAVRKAAASRRVVMATAILLALVALAADSYHVGFLVPRYRYHQYRRRWVRQLSRSTFGAEVARKRAMPRFLPERLGGPRVGGAGAPPSRLVEARGDVPFPPLPVRVLSLRRSADRRKHAAGQLGELGVPFEFVDAVDGDELGRLEEPEIDAYFSGERLRKYRGNLTENARYKVACDLSHFRLAHRLLAGREPWHLVLEDDFELDQVALAAGSGGAQTDAVERSGARTTGAGETGSSGVDGARRAGLGGTGTSLLEREGSGVEAGGGDAAASAAGSPVSVGDASSARDVPVDRSPFLAAVRARLLAAPSDLDVLHLWLCDETLAGSVGRGVALASRGFCTLGMVYTRRAALYILQTARLGLRNIDNLLLDASLTGALNVYVAHPPLIARASSFPSLIDVGEGSKDPF